MHHPSSAVDGYRSSADFVLRQGHSSSNKYFALKKYCKEKRGNLQLGLSQHGSESALPSEATLSSSRAGRHLCTPLTGSLGRHYWHHPHSLRDCDGRPGYRCWGCPSTLRNYHRGFMCSPPPPRLCTGRHSQQRHLGARRWWNRRSIIIRRIRQNHLPPLGLGRTTNANWPLPTSGGPCYLPPLRGWFFFS